MAYLGFGLRQSCSWSGAVADEDVDVIVVAAGVAVAGVADDVVVIVVVAGAEFVDDVFGCGDVLFRLPFPEDGESAAWRRSRSSLASKFFCCR